MIKGILFDLDGVLFNSEAPFVRERVEFLDHINSPLPRERLGLLICTDNSVDIYAKMLEGYEDQIDKEKFKRSMKEYVDEKYGDLILKDLIFPDVKPILEWLKKKGYKIACASRSDMEYISKALSESGIIDYFDVVASGADFTRNKPDPECYLYCMRYLGLDRDECLIVEDSPNGIKAARNAGIRVVVRKEYEIGLDQSGADYYLDTYDELPAIIADIDSINQQ